MVCTVTYQVWTGVVRLRQGFFRLDPPDARAMAFQPVALLQLAVFALLVAFVKLVKKGGGGAAPPTQGVSAALPSLVPSLAPANQQPLLSPSEDTYYSRVGGATVAVAAGGQRLSRG